MWDLLKKADIDQAKRELDFRRAETLRRHAEEGQNLVVDRDELETLNELIDTFALKYAAPAIVPQAQAPAPISTQKIADKTAPEARHQHHRDQRHHQSKH